MATEEQVQDPATSEEISVSVTEEKEFPVDPSLLALSGNNMQHYCTLLSLLEFQNIKPLMFLKTEQGEIPLPLARVVEEFEAGPWLYEGNESVPFDLPPQGSPGPQVQIQYNFVLYSEEDALRGNPPSCWTVSRPEEGTDLQTSENKSVTSGENLSTFSQILTGNSNAASQQQEGFWQANEMDLTAGQGNASEPASEQSNTQNVSGSDLLLEKDLRAGGCGGDDGGGDVSIDQTTPQWESSPSFNSSGESCKGPPVVLERSHTGDGETLCPCPNCGNLFSLNGNLIIHQSPHTRKKLYKCPNCEFLFSCNIPSSAEGHQGTLTDDWERLFRQLNLKHRPSPKADGLKKRFHCPDCGRGFVHKSSIPRHQKLHRKENLSQNLGQEKSCSPATPCSPKAQSRKNPRSCPDGDSSSVGKKRSQFAALCEVCGQVLSDVYKLQRHLATHSQEGPFCCCHCGKSFSFKAVLVRHLLLHQPEKPFQCRYCDRGYIQKSHLDRHYLKHHRICDGKMKDPKGKRLQEEEEDFEPQVELHFTILEESEGGISQGKLWHCDINAELQPDGSSLPEPDDDSVYSDQSGSPSPEPQKLLPAPEKGARERILDNYLQPGPKQQVELHFTILEESEGGISEGRLCASEISSDEPLEIDYPKRQWDGPVQLGQLLAVAKESVPTKDTLEGETKGEVSQQGSADQQVEVQFTIFEDSEEARLSQGLEDYPIWESPFKPDMYQGDYAKEDWDASIDSLGEAFESSFQQQFYSGGRMYPCTECGRIFNRKSTLTRHWRTHTGEKPYSCLDCGRSFSLNLNLLTHQMTHTGEKPYKCPDCGQSFTRSTSVTRHQRSHRDESPYKNDSWEESFPYSYPVPFPYPMPPVEVKSYVCPDCGEAFMHSGLLNRHLRMHRGERPYKCVVCGEGFCSMSKLYRHERIHMVDKPYHCEICGKSFAVKSTLTRHQMLHQAERPYMCSHCEKGYVQRSHLARHHQKAHPDVPFNPVKAKTVPATILDSDNLVTYFWGDEETDTGPEPVPTQLIYSGAD